MTFNLDNKLVIAISSSALFDMAHADKIFKEQGESEYLKYQEKHLSDPFQKGVAFGFIRRLLSINLKFPEIQPVEIVLLSKNSPETGLRAFRSIAHYGLNISRAIFSSGHTNFQYLPAFNASLFLSTNKEDVQEAINRHMAAGTVLKGAVDDDENDQELRIAFDFDGVIADDESEKIYQKSKDITEYWQEEKENAGIPLGDGPVVKLLKNISEIQLMERELEEKDPTKKRIIKIAVVTARNAPAHERVVNTLKNQGVEVDEALFLGGVEKSRFLSIMKPHIFFDDQMIHLTRNLNIARVHIPFGIKNSKS